MRAARAGVPFLALAVVALALWGCGDDDDSGSGETSAAESPHFGYGPEDGPAEWASLDPAWAECATGKRQSPIALGEADLAALPPIGFEYEPSAVELENNGHSIEAAYEPGSAITLDGRTYELAQFHFHAPSEHTVNGASFPLEFHFVHQDAEGNATVIGVFAEEGAADPAYDEIVQLLPELGAEGDHAELEDGLDSRTLMPPQAGAGSRWSYPGSLTTPPCSQGIAWNVLREPVSLSPEQIASFTDVYDHTNRPTQPLDGREVQLSR